MTSLNFLWRWAPPEPSHRYRFLKKSTLGVVQGTGFTVVIGGLQGSRAKTKLGLGPGFLWVSGSGLQFLVFSFGRQHSVQLWVVIHVQLGLGCFGTAAVSRVKFLGRRYADACLKEGHGPWERGPFCCPLGISPLQYYLRLYLEGQGA